MSRRARREAANPGTLRPGDVVEVGRLRYLVQWLERDRRGRLWVVAHGPLDKPAQCGGVALYAGPGTSSRVDALGRRLRLEPLTFFRAAR